MLKTQCSNFLLITSLSDDAHSKKFQTLSKLGFQSATPQLADIHPFLLPLLSQLFNPSSCLPSFVLPAWRTAGRLQDQLTYKSPEANIYRPSNNGEFLRESG